MAHLHLAGSCLSPGQALAQLLYLTLQSSLTLRPSTQWRACSQQVHSSSSCSVWHIQWQRPLPLAGFRSGPTCPQALAACWQDMGCALVSYPPSGIAVVSTRAQ